MSKYFSAIVGVVLLAGLAFGQETWINLETGRAGVPEVIDGHHHPIADVPFILSKGYRLAEPPAAPGAGYERLEPVTWIQHTNDATRAAPVCHDTLIADRLAREEAARLANNFDRLMCQNAYLLLCDSITGTTNHVKLGVVEMAAAMIAVRQSAPATYEMVRDGYNLINAALVASDPAWWDACAWEPNTNVVTAARTFKTMLTQ
jgi:hypothetical protein